jgi:AcrR family transcriptional regulator
LSQADSPKSDNKAVVRSMSLFMVTPQGWNGLRILLTYQSVSNILAAEKGTPIIVNQEKKSVMPPVRSSRSRRKADRPGEIVEAAFEEFVRRGYAATRLEDIAARAGVTKGTIYVYFENKEALFVSMVTEISRAHLTELAREIEAITETGPDFMRPLLTLFCERIAGHDRMMEVLRLLIAEAPRFPKLVDQHFDEFIAPIVSRIGRWLAEGQADGTLRRSALVNIPEMVLGPTMMLQIWMLLFANRRPIDVAAYCETQIDFMLNGIRPRS